MVSRYDLSENSLDSEILKYIQTGFAEDGYLSKPERLARKAMVELVKAGYADFLLLRDDEVRDWWDGITNGIRSKISKQKERCRAYDIKLEAYNKLTAPERKILGIRKPIKPKGYEKA